MADITVEVTSPGSLTTWGYDAYGINSWGQITGVLSQTGNELIEASAELTLSTNLLSVVNGSVSAQANFVNETIGVQLTSLLNSVFAGENIITPVSTSTLQFSIGDETIEATGSINLTGTQLNTTTGTLSLIGDANVPISANIANVTVASITSQIDVEVEVTAPGNLPWGTLNWNYGSWGNLGGMDIEQGGEEESIPGVEVFVSTNLLTLTLTSIAQVTGDANLSLNTNLLTTSLGDEDAVPNTIVEVSTNLLSISVGTASGEVLSTASPVGINMTVSTGRLFISAWAVIDIGVTNTWGVVDIAA